MGSGKVAVITGAGAGIGQAIALEFAKEGVDIVIADIAVEHANDTAKQAESYGVKVSSLLCDIGNVKSIESMYLTVLDKFGRIDILVNNAGIARNIPIEELDEEEWDNMININLKGTFFCSKFAFIEMKKSNGGKIINMASIAGERGGLYAGVNYSASKGGIIAMTKALALKGAEYNITVNAVAPGTVDTEITRRLGHSAADIPLRRKATTQDIASAVAFLASEKANYITGMTLDVNGGQLMR